MTIFKGVPKTDHEWAVEREAQQQHNEITEAGEEYRAALPPQFLSRRRDLVALIHEARHEARCGRLFRADANTFLRFYRERYSLPVERAYWILPQPKQIPAYERVDHHD